MLKGRKEIEKQQQQPKKYHFLTTQRIEMPIHSGV
jgi:hypothetical protein